MSEAAAPRSMPLEWNVRDFALVRSVPSEGGVSYEVLRRFRSLAVRPSSDDVDS